MPDNPFLWIKNIGFCLTLDASLNRGSLGGIFNASILLSQEKILAVGPKESVEIPKHSVTEVDAKGALVTPGLIDCHTHIVFSGSRSDEFFARLQGQSYEEISQKGGGIFRTVKSTNLSEEEELLSLSRRRLDRFLGFGVTTVEVKSGYGLSVENEIRLLRLIKNLNHPIDVVPTFLGAHSIPKEFQSNRQEYIRLVCEEMLPQIQKEKLSSICDVFCEKGVFSVSESRKILTTAKNLGFQIKIHADQLTSLGGTELAGELGALSADHLEKSSEKGIQTLIEKGVVGVLLPGAVFSLGKRTYPNPRPWIDKGLSVAISTDCNPGTSHTENLPLMMTLAAVEMKMKPEEIWSAVTLNAAKALGLKDRGMIKSGLKADLVFWEAENPEEIISHFGVSLLKGVIKNGKLLF